MQTAQVIACSKIISLHLLQSRQPTNIYTPHKGVVNCVHINHTNKVIASCGQDGRIVLVNAQKPDNEVFQTSFHQNSLKPTSLNCIMFSSHSQYLAAGSTDCLIKIWDMKSHKNVFSTIKSHIGSVTSLAWIKNNGIQKTHGQILASSSAIGDIFLHSVKTNNIVETLSSKNQESINQIKVSESDGHCRLAACTSTGSVMVWDVRNLQKDANPICYFNNGKKSSITSVSFSAYNPVLLATASVDQNLTFYDVNQKKSVKVICSEEPLTSINFHSDGHTLVAGGMYGGLFVYDLRKPSKPKEKLIGHDSAIKYTVFIKEYQSTASTMGASRNSQSSVSSYGSSRAPSLNAASEVPKQVKRDNFIQAKNIQTQPQKSNPQLPNSRSQSVNFSKTQTTMDYKRQVPKLSSTGMQAIRNSQMKPQTIPIQSKPPIPQLSSIQYSKPAQTILTNNQKIANTIGQTQAVKNMTYQQGHKIMTSDTTQLREVIEEKFQNLHMELIHQFHLQQMEIKEMITNMLTQDKRKNQRIQQLEKQLNNLKNNTY